MLRNKAMRNLGSIKQTCASFSDSSILITMYCSLVGLNVKYCLLICINNTLKHNYIIESVQNNSLHFISFSIYIDFSIEHTN